MLCTKIGQTVTITKNILSSRLISFNMNLHSKCVNGYYPRTENRISRFPVSGDKIPWNTSFVEYSPVNYTLDLILTKPPVWADLDISEQTSVPKWNDLDGNVNRKSHESTYEIVNGKPRNIRGRTGISGRGCLGRWGPNHAADPIVTKWKLDSHGNKIINENTKKPVLQFVCIQRRDSGQWAIPGGMVDPGETVTTTLKREFFEEAMNSLEMTDDQKKDTETKLNELFSQGEKVYSGYVDDPRNTDNAWMETVAYNFHNEKPDDVLYSIKLEAGDDAQNVKWMDISSELDLYASHIDFIKKVSDIHQAHW